MFIVTLLCVLFIGSCAMDEPNSNEAAFTPWDVQRASAGVSRQAQQDKTPTTVMIYMNGSDLESDHGAATNDLVEMLNSGVNTNNVNVILFTGGTRDWQNNAVPANECVIWKVSGNSLEEVANVGLVDMGNPGTLASFIEFSTQNFPADQYGLILWDHGGGSIVGFGSDEKFNKSSLTLTDMDAAFKYAGLDTNKLEFLGFDSCLMATVEMAVIASNYAHYLIASQDTEPADGWDYHILGIFNENPHINGEAFGIAVVDSFMDFYEGEEGHVLTLSVVKLSEASLVMDAMGALMRRCSSGLVLDASAFFPAFAEKRYNTKTFALGSPRDSDADMVDIGDMARHLSYIFPNESAEVFASLDNAVLYNRHNSTVDVKGLSAYYIYGGISDANLTLKTYHKLGMDDYYTQYLFDFADILSGPQKTVERPRPHLEERMASINGHTVLMYEISRCHNEEVLYAIPAEVNGLEADIIVLVSQLYHNGRVLGYRKFEGAMKQKGVNPIIAGDSIALYSLKGEEWFKSDLLIADAPLHISLKI